MPRNDHKKELRQLSEAYKNVYTEEHDEYHPGYGKVEEKDSDHVKGVKMALEALEMFKDELHIDGHPEDINVNELADAHDQLSRALHWLFDETDVEYITGGRATQRSEADSQPEQFTSMEFPSDES